jgi:hypothetical protein
MNCYEYKLLPMNGHCVSCQRSVDITVQFLNTNTNKNSSTPVCGYTTSIKPYQIKDIENDIESWFETESREFVSSYSFTVSDRIDVDVIVHKSDYTEHTHRNGFTETCEAMTNHLVSIIENRT